jgi:hypothetical protein
MENLGVNMAYKELFLTGPEGFDPSTSGYLPI